MVVTRGRNGTHNGDGEQWNEDMKGGLDGGSPKTNAFNEFQHKLKTTGRGMRSQDVPPHWNEMKSMTKQELKDKLHKEGTQINEMEAQLEQA